MSFICAVWANYVSTWTTNCKCYCCVACAVKVGLLQTCLWGIPKNQRLRVKRVQDTAARIVTQTTRLELITFFLLERHWLPVEMRIDYKILSLVYSYMNDTAPQYLRELIPRYLPVRYLRSSTQSRLRIPSVDQGKKKQTLWSQSIFQCCTQTVELSAHYSEIA